jgi:hypothetical protein
MGDGIAVWGVALGAIGAASGLSALYFQGRSYRLDQKGRHDPVLAMLHEDLLNEKRTMQWWQTEVRSAGADQYEPKDVTSAASVGLYRMESMARTLRKPMRVKVLLAPPVHG